MGFKTVQKFISRLVVGCILGVLIGNYLDEMFHTKPLIIFVILIYVIFGSLYLLVKEAGK